MLLLLRFPKEFADSYCVFCFNIDFGGFLSAERSSGFTRPGEENIWFPGTDRFGTSYAVTSAHPTLLRMFSVEISCEDESAEDRGVVGVDMLDVRLKSRFAEPNTRSKAPPLDSSRFDSRGGVGGRAGLSGEKFGRDRVSISTMAASAKVVLQECNPHRVLFPLFSRIHVCIFRASSLVERTV